MATSHLSDLVGRVLAGRYRLVAPLGSGASARVYLADDTQLRRRVAVKVLHEGMAEDPGFLKRFGAEALAAAALNHPNVMHVYDSGTDGGLPYLVCEYLSGGSLQAMLANGQRLTPSQALVVGLEVARGLDYAHRQGFVHRDIKPANLLFGEDGRLRIGDFGLARAIAEAAWTEPQGMLLGTVRYAAPEQARGQSVDGRADVYSLALVLIEAVTGSVPFQADTTTATLMARCEGDLPVPTELGRLRPVLVRAGRLAPEERADAGELEIGFLAAAEDMDRPGPLPLAGALDPAAEAAAAELTNLPAEAVVESAVTPDGRNGGAPVVAPRDDITVIMPVATAAAAAAVTAGLAADDLVDDAVDEVDALADLDAEPDVDPAEDLVDDEGEPDEQVEPEVDAAAEDLVDEEVTEVDVPPAAARSAVVDIPLSDEVEAVPPPRVPPAALADVDPVADPTAPRRGRRVALIVLAVVLLAGAAVGAFLLLRTPSAPVPGVVGLDYAEAQQQLSGNGWTVTTQLERKDGTEADEVIGQKPSEGTDLKEGEKVTLQVSRGYTMVTLPSVATLPEAQTVEALEALGLQVSPTIARPNDEVAPAGTVMTVTTDPPVDASGQLPRNSVVSLTVSAGPAPRTVPAGLVGQSYDAASSQLAALQLEVERSDAYSDQPVGTVLTVEPAAGAQVARDSTVKVTVSKGPEPKPIPNVVGMTVFEASTALQANGFTVSGVDGSTLLSVRATNPPAGGAYPPGTAVQLITRR